MTAPQPDEMLTAEDLEQIRRDYTSTDWASTRHIRASKVIALLDCIDALQAQVAQARQEAREANAHGAKNTIVKGYEGGIYVRRCGQCHRVAVVSQLKTPAKPLPRYVQVANLRATGMSLSAIARELNIATSSAGSALQRAKRKGVA